MERICAPAELFFDFVRSFIGAGAQIRSFLTFDDEKENMMNKKAVIVVGEHGSGKSRLIREFLKPLCGMTINQQYSVVNGRRLWIKSQTLQEAQSDLTALLNKLDKCDSLVMPSWPMEKGSPSLKDVISAIKSHGFDIAVIEWVRANNDKVCKAKANDIFNIISK